MARHANIVSFDDVKKASAIRRAQEAQEGGRLEGIGVGRNYYDLSRFADPLPRERDWEDDYAPQTRTSSRGRTPDRAERPQRARQADRIGRTGRASRTEGPDRNGRSNSSERTGRTSRSESPSRSQRRNSMLKARADAMFTKQYGDEGSFSEPDGAPRAALYEAHMGSSHRKAARMQLASQAGSSMAKLNPAGWFSGLSVSPRRMKVATVVLCLVLTVVFLYTPAQQYYQSLREHDRLAAEYAIVEERNATLTAQNDSLSSNAGMEDAVRQKYGYVKAGDATAVVTGLSEATTNAHRSANDVEANVLSSSVKAPEEWYTPYLDTFFGVS